MAYLTPDNVVIFILAAMNAFQFLYWAHQCQKLVDKLMCRNFGEYQLAKKPLIPAKGDVLDEDLIAEEKQILDQLNSMVS